MKIEFVLFDIANIKILNLFSQTTECPLCNFRQKVT